MPYKCVFALFWLCCWLYLLVSQFNPNLKHFKQWNFCKKWNFSKKTHKNNSCLEPVKLHVCRHYWVHFEGICWWSTKDLTGKTLLYLTNILKLYWKWANSWSGATLWNFEEAICKISPFTIAPHFWIVFFLLEVCDNQLDKLSGGGGTLCHPCHFVTSQFFENSEKKFKIFWWVINVFWTQPLVIRCSNDRYDHFLSFQIS